jgi:xylulose-5-phosphate/fructose-6-phosphate phosphoketolase
MPPDANCWVSVADHCLRSRHYVNVIVAGKQPSLNYLSIEDAVLHCIRGLGIWEWASNDEGYPDVVIACCGDIPTLETLAGVEIIRRELPELKLRGYKEEGTTTTPFDMVMLNDLDRFHLVMDVIDRVPGLGSHAAGLRQSMADERARCRAHTRAEGDDPSEVRDWVWPN